MQNIREENLSADSPRQAAMNWIGNLLETKADCVRKQITNWHWEIDDTEGNATTYKLVVVGSRDRRAIKLFTTDELDRCLCDKELQSEINERLTRIVTFLDGRNDNQRAQRTVKKLR